MEGLSIDWQIKEPVIYLGLVIITALVLRFLFACIKAIRVPFDTAPESTSYLNAVTQIFLGFMPKESPIKSDYWYNFIVGLFELAIFPILIACHAWIVLGAWMGFKTVAQWGAWSDDRSTFNLFLIGNLLVLAAAFFVLLPFVQSS